MKNAKRFISKNSNLRIVLKHGIPPEPITGRLAVPGLSIKFENGVVNISDEETIELMMAHSGFNSDFILANEEEEVDPWKWQRREKEPQHNLTELKYGHVEKTITPKKSLDGMSVDKRMLFEKMVEDTAKKIAVPLAKEMLKKVMKDQEEENISENSKAEIVPEKTVPVEKLNVPESDGTVISEKVKFVCSYCGKEAKSKAGLMAHERNCKSKKEKI